MNTKVIALDIYGTILQSDDTENRSIPRPGFEEFIARCKSQSIQLVSASDADMTNLKLDLESTFKNSRHTLKPTLDIFDKFYRLPTVPKDFSEIISDYNITPNNLFVIGDTFHKDLLGAKSLGCSTLLVPEYDDLNPLSRAFNFNSIIIS